MKTTKNVCEVLINEDEAFQRTKKRRLTNKAKILLAIGGLGVVLALISCSCSGQKLVTHEQQLQNPKLNQKLFTVEQIEAQMNDTWDNIKDKAQEWTQASKEKISDWKESAQDTASDVNDKWQQGKGYTKAKTEDFAESAKDKITDTYESATDTISDVFKDDSTKEKVKDTAKDISKDAAKDLATDTLKTGAKVAIGTIFLKSNQEQPQAMPIFNQTWLQAIEEELEEGKEMIKQWWKGNSSQSPEQLAQILVLYEKEWAKVLMEKWQELIQHFMEKKDVWMEKFEEWRKKTNSNNPASFLMSLQQTSGDDDEWIDEFQKKWADQKDDFKQWYEDKKQDLANSDTAQKAGDWIDDAKDSTDVTTQDVADKAVDAKEAAGDKLQDWRQDLDQALNGSQSLLVSLLSLKQQIGDDKTLLNLVIQDLKS